MSKSRPLSRHAKAMWFNALLVALFCACLVALLSGCDNHDGEHCTHHTTIITPHKVGKTTTYSTQTICTNWEPDPTPSPK